jgi:hypothetical protein
MYWWPFRLTASIMVSKDLSALGLEARDDIF